MSDRQEMIAILEAILFVSNDPVPRAKLMEVFDEKDREEASLALDDLLERYQQRPEHGVLADEVAGGVRLVTRPDLHSYLRRFFDISGTNKLSMAALETLSIIAYRQPVTAPEIQELRSVSSSGVIKTLLERRLIRVAGRKEVVGKPFIYTTTRDFLMHFGLKNLKELPPLEQFEELFGMEVEAAESEAGQDVEEEILREAAELEEAEADAAEEEERQLDAEETAAREAAELELEPGPETEPETGREPVEEPEAKAESEAPTESEAPAATEESAEESSEEPVPVGEEKAS